MISEYYTDIDKNVDDHEGTQSWQPVEAALIALSQPDVFDSFPDALPLQSLLERCMKHPNRFVRENLFSVICALFEKFDGTCLLAPTSGWDVTALVALIRAGLADNWSQVRFNASKVVRVFFTKTVKANPEPYYDALLPPLCLNRRYIADGVRNYTLESWKLVVGLRGPELIVNHLPAFIDFYEVQADADNHAVREAACHCISELATRIDKDGVRPFVGRLMDILLVAFQDDSWPVRDVACVSTASFIEQFPSECAEKLSVVDPLIMLQCGDPIPSVRTHAADSIAKLLRAYGESERARWKPRVTEMLKAVQHQTSTVTAGYENVTTFAVAKRIHDNDEARHMDQTMFSCGSLAPRMAKGSARKKFCGCTAGGAAGVKRTDDPWFLTDCALQAIEHWATIYPDDVSDWLPGGFVEAVKCTQYVHHVKLWVTAFTVLPRLVSTLLGGTAHEATGRALLSDMIAPMIQALDCPNDLAANAAAHCVQVLKEVPTTKTLFATLCSEEQNLILSNHKLLKPKEHTHRVVRRTAE
eukprot:PhM_4_TR15223/c0_g1_i1/m.95670